MLLHPLIYTFVRSNKDMITANEIFRGCIVHYERIYNTNYDIERFERENRLISKCPTKEKLRKFADSYNPIFGNPRRVFSKFKAPNELCTLLLGPNKYDELFMSRLFYVVDARNGIIGRKALDVIITKDISRIKDEFKTFDEYTSLMGYYDSVLVDSPKPNVKIEIIEEKPRKVMI